MLRQKREEWDKKPRAPKRPSPISKPRGSKSHCASERWQPLRHDSGNLSGLWVFFASRRTARVKWSLVPSSYPSDIVIITIQHHQHDHPISNITSTNSNLPRNKRASR